MDPIRKRFIMVGDEMCGKTSLCIAFVEGTFEIGVPADGNQVGLALCAASNQDQPVWVPRTHVIAICFAVDSPVSLVNVEKKWISDVSCYYPFLPILLLGCKKDLRDDPETIEKLQKKSRRPVISEEGSGTADEISAYKYLKCLSQGRRRCIRCIPTCDTCRTFENKEVILVDDYHVYFYRKRCFLSFDKSIMRPVKQTWET